MHATTEHVSISTCLSLCSILRTYSGTPFAALVQSFSSSPAAAARPLSTFCSRLGLPQCVINDIVEETMRAGVHGPAVTIFVVMSLLCLAEKQGAEDADVVSEGRCSRSRLPLMAASHRYLFQLPLSCPYRPPTLAVSGPTVAPST